MIGKYLPNLRTQFEIVAVIAPIMLVLLLGEQIRAALPYLYLYAGPFSVVIATIIATIFLRWRGQTWRDMGIRKLQRWWIYPVGVIATYLATGVLVGLVIQPLAAAMGFAAQDLSFFKVVKDDLFTFLMFAFPVSWGAAAFGEEMLARGFLLNRFADIFGTTKAGWILAMIAQAVLFGLAHSYQGVTGAMIVTGVGLTAGAAYLLTGRNLWVPIITHGLLDFVSLIAIYAGTAQV